MKLLIIGASGFIGSSIFKKAVEEKTPVWGTGFKGVDDNLIYFNLLKGNFDEILPSEFKNNPQDALALICSANPSIEGCKKNYEESYNLNVLSTKKLMGDLAKNKIKFCFISTDCVYDGVNGYYSEDEQQCPCNEYGRQKSEIEKFILENHKSDLIFRISQTLSNVNYGKHIFAEWNRWCKTSKEILCIKDNFFSPTFVNDIYYALGAAFSKKKAGLYNCVNGEHFSREELARQFVRHLYPGSGVKVITKTPEEFGFSEKRALKTYLDNTKIVSELAISFTSMKTVFRTFDTGR